MPDLQEIQMYESAKQVRRFQREAFCKIQNDSNQRTRTVTETFGGNIMRDDEPSFCFPKGTERQKVNDSILFKVFYSIYCLAKEGIANKKAAGLLTLLEKLGVNDLKYFDHQSPASVREMFSSLGCAVKENVVTRAKTAGCFGLLVDDVSDISVMEQMITFIQFYDKDSSEVTVEFLSVDNLLEKHDSANAVAVSHNSV